jgi:hypothetical protein
MNRRSLSMMSVAGALLLALGVGLGARGPVAYAAGKTYYVALLGSDSNPGTAAQPFRTIQRCASVAASGDTCVIRAGTYRETIIPNSGVTFRPDTNATVTVSGADPLTGWTQDSGSIYRANVALNSSLKANQVFVNDTMVFLARWPNMPVNASPMDIQWATAGPGSGASAIYDSSLPNINWSGAIVHVWGGTNPFTHQTGSVTSSSAGQVNLTTSAWSNCPGLCAIPGARYYLSGVRAALDTAGEWFYDTSAQRLYLWAPGGGSPGNVTVKQREWAFDLRGRSNVTIQGIQLFAAGIITDGASQNNLIEGISARYLSHFDTFGTSFKLHTTDTGIVLNGSGNIVRNSTLAYSAGNGVGVVGDGNTVTNNLIYDAGYGGTYATAVLVAPNRSNVTITYNTIYRTARDGISLDYDDVRGGDIQKNHTIAYNRVYSYGLWTNDVAGIYACCHLDASGTKIHHNWVYHYGVAPGALPWGSRESAWAAGIYTDNGSGGFAIFQNVLWQNRSAGIYLHGDGGPLNGAIAVYNNTIFGSQGDATNNDQARGVYLCGANGWSGTSVQNNKVPNDPSLLCLGEVSYSGATFSSNTATAIGANEGISATVGCNLSGCGGESPPTVVNGARTAVQPIQAEGFDDASGPRVSLGMLADTNGGEWARYTNVDFGSGVDTLVVRVSVPPEYAGGTIAVRLGSTSGTLLGTLTVQATGSFDSNYQEQQINIASASGVHDVYLVFGGTVAGNIDWFKFTRAAYPSATNQIEAERYTAQQGVVNNGSYVGGLDTGDWLRYDLDFGGGVARFTANIGVPAEYAGKQIQVRLDSASGAILGTLTVQSTGNWTTFRQQSVNLTQSISGQRSIYLTFSGGNGVGDLDWITFGAATPLASVEAEQYSSQSGITNFGTGIGSLDTNDWAAYNGVNLGSGASRIEFRVAVDPCCAGKQIEIRQGSVIGALLGTLTVQNTGGWNSYTTQSAALSGASGTHTLYLVFKGGNGVGNIDWFRVY